MPGTNERLGIELFIDMTKVQSGLDAFKKALDTTFKVGGISKLLEQMAKLDGATEKAAKGFTASKTAIKNFAEAFTGGDLDKAKKKMEEIFDANEIKKWGKAVATETANTTSVIQKGIDAKVAGEKKAADAIIAEAKRVTEEKSKQNDKELAWLSAKDKQLSSSAKQIKESADLRDANRQIAGVTPGALKDNVATNNTAAFLRAEDAKIRQAAGTNYLATLKKSEDDISKGVSKIRSDNASAEEAQWKADNKRAFAEHAANVAGANDMYKREASAKVTAINEAATRVGNAVRDADARLEIARNKSKQVNSFESAAVDIRGKDAGINKIATAYPNANVAGIRSMQQEVAALVGKGGGTAELDVIAQKLRILSKEMGIVRSEASSVKAIDPFSNMFKGLPVATTTMAELHAKLTAVYGDLSKLDGKSFGNVTSQLSKYNAELKDGAVQAKAAGGAFDFLGATVGRMAGRLVEFYGIRAVLFSVSNHIQEAIGDIVKFNQALADTAAISNASGAGMKSFEASAVGIATSSKMGLEEVMKLMNLLAQSGVSEKDVPIVSRVTSMFATGTGSSAENAVRVVTTAMNVWNITGEKAVTVTNTLTAALNASKLEVNELSTVFNYLAPLAKQAGMSLQETSAIIATQSQMGVKPSTIGTGMGQLIEKFMVPTKRVKELAAAYDIAIEDLNPKYNKFADIIKKFETASNGKAVPVEDLIYAFGERAGKSMAAAVTAGSEYFTMMERNVSTGTSALVAYSIAIEGPGAKMNILKQNFIQAVSSMNIFNDVIKVVYDVLLNVTRGLEGTLGPLLMLVSSITVAIPVVYALGTALKTIGMSNWIGLALTGVALAVTALSASLGQLSPEAKKLDAEQKELAKSAGDTQRVFTTLTGIYREAAVQGNQHGKMTDEHKKQLLDLMRTTPSFREELAKIGGSYDNLSAAADNYNRKLETMALRQIDIYNKSRNVVLAKADEKTWGIYGNKSPNDMVKTAERLRDVNTKSVQAWPAGVEKDAALRKINEQYLIDEAKAMGPLKGDIDRAETSFALAGQRGMPEKGVNPKTDLERKFPKMVVDVATEDTTNHQAPRLGGTSGSTAPTYTPTDFEAINRDLVNATAKIGADTQIKVLEAQIKHTEENMKFASDVTAKTEFEEEGKTLDVQLASWVTAKRKEAYDDLWSSILGKAKGTFTPGTEKNPNGSYKFEDTRDQANFEKNLAGLAANVETQIGIKAPQFDAKAGLMGGKRPEYNPPEVKDKSSYMGNSDRAVKAADRELATRTKQLEVEKELAHTADEIQQIGIKELDAQLHMADEKKKAFQTELTSIENAHVSAEDMDKVVARYETVYEQLQAIVDLEDAWKRKRDADSNNGFMFNLAAGFDKATIALGTFKSNTEALGNTLGSSLYGGVSNSLNSAFSTITNPDTKAIGGLRTEITALQKQKASLEANINGAQANTSLTPVETKNLADQKVALQGVNEKLGEQEQALKKQTNAWAAFGEGMKNVMKIILQELQKYVIQLFVVAMAKKLAGMAANFFGGTSGTLGADVGAQSGGSFLGNGSILSGATSSGATVAPTLGTQPLVFGDGGQVPMSAGKPGLDSVKAWLTPGEIVINPKAVSRYGAQYFLDHNAQKFADGGLVGGGSGVGMGSKGGNAGGKQDITLVINNIADPSQLQNKPLNAMEITNIISYDLARKGPISKSIKASLG